MLSTTRRFTCRLFTRSLMCSLLLIFFLAPLFSAAVSELPAAADEVEEGFPLTLTDDLGTSVTISRKPQTLISLSLFSDEVLMKLLPAEAFAAVSTMTVNEIYSNVADQAAGIKPVIDFNVETIIQLYPDLVIAANWSEADKIAQLRQAGITVYQIDTPFDIPGIRQAILRLGELTGTLSAAEVLNHSIDERIAALQTAVARISPDQRLSALDYNSWGTANGADTTWNLILELAGIDNAVGHLQSGDFGQVQLSKEVLIELDPDVIFLPSYIWGDDDASGAFFRQVTEDPALAGIKAITKGRAYIFPEKLKNSYSQFLVDAAELAARTVYPGLF